MIECPFCGEFVGCNNAEKCDTCRHLEDWLKAEEKEIVKGA